MHNREKYPEIWAAMEKAKAELAPLMDKRKKHTVKIDELRNKQIEAYNKAQVPIDAENDLAMADIDRIRELRKQISSCARAMMGYGFSHTG